MKQSSLRSPSRLQPSSHGHHPHQRASHNLHLPGLPRFHPANYQQTPSLQSCDSSTSSSPCSGLNSPQPPVSPRSQQRMYSDAQRQLYSYQRDMMARGIYLDPETGNNRASTAPQRSSKPASPKLHPLGSPGPVTPLELEEEQQQHQHDRQHASYFLVGAHHHLAHYPRKGGLTEEAKDQLLDSFAQRGEAVYSRPSSSSSTASATAAGSSMPIVRRPTPVGLSR